MHGQIALVLACSQLFYPAGAVPNSPTFNMEARADQATAAGKTTLPRSILDGLRGVRDTYVGPDVARTIMRVAERGPPSAGKFPDTTDHSGMTYNYQGPTWWTAGFFPGSVWEVYERTVNHSGAVPFKSGDVLTQARTWQKGMASQQNNKGTHDLGFMIMPAFYRDYTLTGNSTSKDVVVQAGKSLSSRWSDTVQSIRSWDTFSNLRFHFTDKTKDYLVIIDNMMNLDLLYVTSQITGDPEYARRATAHAHTTLKNHIRPDNSTFHLVDYDPSNGAVKGKYTVQGYIDSSTWSRGQAWGLCGFATAYKHTGEQAFLDTSVKLARYFAKRVADNKAKNGAGTVPWDFDAPQDPLLLDTSAAMIASSGMLLLYQVAGVEELLPTVVDILKYCAAKARAPKNADAYLLHATVNNNQYAGTQTNDTGLVYADYYLLEVGNRLLELGLT